MSNEQVLTTQELAGYMKLNEKTILKMAQKGALPGVKIGNQWRFHMEAIDRYLQRDIMHTPEGELDSIITADSHILSLSRLFDISLMELNSSSATSEKVLMELAEISCEAGIADKKEKLLKQLMEREAMLSTAVGNGIAVPHPRKPSPALFKEPNVVMIRSEEGVDFKAPDNKKVYLFFMTCAPNMVVHLRLLAMISKLFQIEGVIDKFMLASQKEEIIRFLLELERKDLFPWKG